MDQSTERGIAALTVLGTELGREIPDPAFCAAARCASTVNPWFSFQDICFAARALAYDMLQEDMLRSWAERYPSPTPARTLTVGIIMAGNLPMVGFHDLLCTLMSGHRCLVKPSSKDRPMTDYLLERLHYIDPQLPIGYWTNTSVDAVIATGSDNTNRYFRARFHTVPTLFRGSRHSVAILTGEESEIELIGLAEDIFRYNGMGCRSVSRLFLPAGYDPTTLLPFFGRYAEVNPKYRNNYRQTKALARMQNRPFLDGGFYILTPAETTFSDALSQITYSHYTDLQEVVDWLTSHDRSIQCIVSREMVQARCVPFGQAQHPHLDDYADGVDTMRFLQEIKKSH